MKIKFDDSDIILDFFSGSATTAHAVMQLNAEDGGKRKFIMVQLLEPCAPESEAAKAGYASICEIGKECIRRAGEKINAELGIRNAELKGQQQLDLGNSELFTVHTYNDGDLIACFDKHISDAVVKEIARRQPLRAVFRDSGFASSPEKINVEEIFKLLAPNTSVRVI